MQASKVLRIIHLLSVDQTSHLFWALITQRSMRLNCVLGMSSPTGEPVAMQAGPGGRVGLRCGSSGKGHTHGQSSVSYRPEVHSGEDLGEERSYMLPLLSWRETMLPDLLE